MSISHVWYTESGVVIVLIPDLCRLFFSFIVAPIMHVGFDVEPGFLTWFFAFFLHWQPFRC